MGNNELVSYDNAKVIRKLGLPISCDWYYNKNEELSKNVRNNVCGAPNQDVVIDFLCEACSIDIIISDSGWEPDIYSGEMIYKLSICDRDSGEEYKFSYEIDVFPYQMIFYEGKFSAKDHAISYLLLVYLGHLNGFKWEKDKTTSPLKLMRHGYDTRYGLESRSGFYLDDIDGFLVCLKKFNKKK